MCLSLPVIPSSALVPVASTVIGGEACKKKEIRQGCFPCKKNNLAYPAAHSTLERETAG
jgi:hypothetical protein